MKPYYQDDQVTLYHGDCLEVAEWLNADVLVTDPPYGIGWNQPAYKTKGATEGTRTTAHAGIQNDGDTSVRDEVIFRWRMKPGIVFGAIDRKWPVGTNRVLVWKKPNDSGLFGQSIWRKDWEAIFVTGAWERLPATESAVITTGAGSHRQYAQGIHPHAKPIDVLEKLIAKCPTGVIADPFAGSGSTLIAARNLGRQAIGVELEERYCEIIAKRLDQMCLDFGGAS